ncbi:MAG TPA: hypothetical protein DCQ06_08380 [Myxococcales bacterium]|nr:hypothetical protein [Myxococcales bacterium]HAN31596.1 hypothetical protein [Myxococcales bacterium]
MTVESGYWSDLLGAPRVLPEQSVSIEAALASGHPSLIAQASVQAAHHAEPAMATCAFVLAQHGPYNSAICAVAAALGALVDHEGPRAALPLARAMDTVAAQLRTPAAADIASAQPDDSLSSSVQSQSLAGVAGWIEKALEGRTLQELEDELIDALYANAGTTAHLAPIVVAAIEVARVAKPKQARVILGGAAQALACRQSPLPEEARELVAGLSEVAADLWARQDPAKASAFQEARFRPHLIGANPTIQIKALTKAVAFGVPRSLIADSLSIGAAQRLLHFDPSHARSVRTPEGWLDMGWLLQVAVATRKLLLLREQPLWLSLLGHVVVMLGASSALETAQVEPLPEPQTADRNWDHGPQIAQVTGAMLAADAPRAMAALRGYLLMVLPEQPLCAGLISAVLEDRAATAHEQGHLLSCLSAALEAFSGCGNLAHREILPCAAIRLFVHLMSQRPVYQLTHGLVDQIEGAKSVAGTPCLPWLVR